MTPLETFFSLSLLLQILHAMEELSTGFHKQWYLMKMPLWVFLLFEIIFEGFWIFVWFSPALPNRSSLQAFFLVLMFANGVQHLVWAGTAKKYVPGLLTAPFHIIISLIFYFRVFL